MALDVSRPARIAGALLAAAALLSPLLLISHAQNPQRPAIQTPGGGRGPGAAPGASDPANANADLSPKPPVLAATPAEQATRFWLPAGYRMEPVLSDPIIEDPVPDRLRRQRPHVRRRGARLLSDARRHRPDSADRPRVDARGSRQRRRLRAPLRLRRQDGVPALRHAVRRQHRPDDGDQRGRSVEAHGYQRATAWPTRKSSSRPTSGAPATWSPSRPACSGRWTTGSTAR